MHLKQRVGTLIKALRERRNYTQANLAKKVGISSDAISQIERGVSAPSYPTLERIAEALGTALPDLFDVPGSDTSPDRVAKLAIIADIARGLSDLDLDVAVRQMEALGSRGLDN